MLLDTYPRGAPEENRFGIEPAIIANITTAGCKIYEACIFFASSAIIFLW